MNSERLLLVIMTSAAAVLAVMVIVLLLILKKRKNRDIADTAYKTEILSQTCTDTARTVPVSDGKTAVLFSDDIKFTVTLTDENDPDEKYEMTAGEIVIGRNSHMSDVVISSDSNISQRHCKIYARDSSVYISDLGSLNNTYVNGEPAGEEHFLKSGDILGIGKKKYIIEFREIIA